MTRCVSRLVRIDDLRADRLILNVRHGLTHTIRLASELAVSDPVKVTGPQRPLLISEAIDRETHLAILLASHKEILRVAVDEARYLAATGDTRQ
jgi:hypothetical protein